MGLGHNHLDHDHLNPDHLKRNQRTTDAEKDVGSDLDPTDLSGCYLPEPPSERLRALLKQDPTLESQTKQQFDTLEYVREQGLAVKSVLGQILTALSNTTSASKSQEIKLLRASLAKLNQYISTKEEKLVRREPPQEGNEPAAHKKVGQKKEAVDHPDHYNSGKIEVIEFIDDRAMGRGFALGNAIKYISRAGKKHVDREIQDLKKAAWYINWYVEKLEASERSATQANRELFNSRTWAEAVIAAKIDSLTLDLEAAGLKKFRVLGTGAMITGHYDGPKQRDHSLNEDCPEQFNQVVEIDLRVLISADQDPHNAQIMELIKTASGSGEVTACYSNRWGRTWPQAMMYSYDSLGGDIGLETEIVISKEPYPEIAHYWKDVFSKEEIDWQRELRETLRTMNVDYVTEFYTLKRSLCIECSWRIVAAEALSQLQDQCQDLPPLALGDTKSFVAAFAAQWLQGISGIEGLDRPAKLHPGEVDYALTDVAPGVVLAQETVEKLKDLRPDLLQPPKVPEWVQRAEEYRRQFLGVRE